MAMTRPGSQVVDSRPDPHDAGEFGQVLRFPRRPNQPPFPVAATQQDNAAAADDLAQYEQEQDEVVDYRQRMLMNVIALAVVTLLVGAGAWLAGTIAELQRDQDCIMQGRSNCAPLEIPPPKQQ